MTWHVRITHTPSGSIIHDGPLPQADIRTIEQITDDIIEEVYAGELSRDEADGIIPSGCGEYRTELRDTPEYEDWRCWEAHDWFARVG